MTRLRSEDTLPLFFLTAVLAAFVCCIQYDPFFWDTVQLASKHAHFFYERGLRWAALPPDMDSGHPPLLGWYLAAVWTVFGKTLPASHWAMFPFLWANAMLLYRLGKRLGGAGWAAWLLPLALLDPVMGGQSALISPDVVLATCFLLGVEAILAGRSRVLMLAVLGLCTISMRGMMTAAALGLWQVLAGLAPEVSAAQRLRRKMLIPYLPGFALAAAFLLWHWQTTGWIGHHAGSPWAGAFVRAQGMGLVRNAAVLAWRWADLGRWAEWVVVAVLLWRGSFRRDALLLRLLLLCVAVAVALSPSGLLYANLSAHRYFLPLFLSLHLLVFRGLAADFFPQNAVATAPPLRAYIVWVLLLISLSTGHLWVYPRGVSLDWDCTWAHWPYHQQRAAALRFLGENGILLRQTGSAFPNLSTGEYLLLNGDTTHFVPIDWQHNTYVLASNVFNDLNAPDFRRLDREWLPLCTWQHPAGTWMTLYRRKP